MLRTSVCREVYIYCPVNRYKPKILISLPAFPMTFLDIFKHHSSKSTSQSRAQSSKSKMSHATATLNGKVIAEADNFQTVEGNIYVRLPTLTREIRPNDS